MKTKDIMANAVLIAISLSLCFLVLEVGTRLLVKDYVRALHNVIPEKVISFVPNSESHYQSDEFDFVVKANRFGRRDSEWTEDVLKDPNNILFIGDSFVLGYGVNDHFTQPTLLEKHLRKDGKDIEVLNFGLSWGFPEYYQMLEDANSLKIAAKQVMVGIFVGNDFSQDPNSVRMGKEQYVRQGDLMNYRQSAFLNYLKKRLVGSPMIMGIAFKIADLLGMEIYASSASYIFLRDQSSDERERFNKNLQELLKIKELAENNGKQIAFVLFPNKLQVENFDELSNGPYNAAKPNELTMQFCRQHEMSCLDLLPKLREDYEMLNERLYFPVDRHFTELGNQVASAHIYQYLSDRVVSKS